MSEKIAELMDRSVKNIKIADHMVYITYNLFKDPKILLAIMENLYLALSSAMASLLYYEREKRHVHAFPDNFNAQFHLFNEHCAPKYNIEEEHIKTLKEVSDIIIAHRKSPVEFIRKDRFVICDGDYKMRTLSVQNIKEYVNSSKQFIRKVNEAITND